MHVGVRRELGITGEPVRIGRPALGLSNQRARAERSARYGLSGRAGAGLCCVLCRYFLI
jgi:hypothetical protein